MSKKNSKNYLDYIPVRNPDVEYETADDGRVTVFVEWKGFYHRIAQKFFHTEKLVKLLDDHKNGKADNSRRVWTVYAFLIWYKQFFSESPREAA